MIDFLLLLLSIGVLLAAAAADAKRCARRDIQRQEER